MDGLPKPILVYCDSGLRAVRLWALSQAADWPAQSIIERAAAAGYDLRGAVCRLINGGRVAAGAPVISHAVVVVGGGAAGMAVASRLLRGHPDLDLAVIDPSEVH